MHTSLAMVLAATALVAQSSPVPEPRLAGVLEPLTAAQYLLPVRGFSLAQLAYGPVPHPALRAGAASFYVPDPLLCSANYVGAEVVQLVFALPQGPIVLLDASSTLALHVLPVPASTWSLLAGVCIDGRHDQVVLLDAAGPRFLRIDLVDLRAGTAQFQSTWLPSEWSTVRGIAFDFARDRIVGVVPGTGALLQHSVAVATVLNPSAGALSPVPRLLAFGFAPTGGVGHDLFVSSGDPRMLTSRWTWNDAGPDGGGSATLLATVATSAWSPPSPDPSAIGFDDIRDRLMVSDGEVEEMTIYAGKNVWEASRAGVVSRSTTTVGYSSEPVGITFQSANRTFYISDDGTPDAVYVVAVGPDGLLHTPDDTRRSFNVANFPTDPEDTAFDNASNELWIAGGTFSAVHRLRPGPNGIFDGIPPVGDDQLFTINVSTFGVTDVEGVAVRPSDGGIYVIGNPITTLLHLSNTGQFVRTINLPSTGLIKPAGIVFAPRSSGTGDSLYLVDRGIDNEFFPTENDGMMFEYEVPGATGVNQPPVVNAGPDVTILPTQAANLAGIATDDGLVVPLTIQWSQLSGPGAASFAAPTQAATTATFSAVGSYTLQLSAFDGEFTSTDTCVVTVTSGNQPPVVDAGPDVTTAVTSSAHLAGSATDDGLPGPLTIQWSQLSGPGQANFTAPTQPVTDVTFSAAGSYMLQLSAFDGEFTSTDTCVVTVTQSNQAPVVNAGPDVTTAITTSAHLAGHVQDDGLPGGPLTIQWGQLSGPGQAYFTSPTQPVTDVTFSAVGSYTLQLAAFDGELWGGDTCVVTVQAVNQPPVVNAGPDVTTAVTSSAHLAGSATDDGLPGPLTIQWGQLSGPGQAYFTSPTQPVTDVTFSAPGSYTLQLWASDGQYASTDTCVVTAQAVNQPPVVDAGPDVTVAVTSSAHLAGTVNDDGLPGGPLALVVQWIQLSGPGQANFTAPTQPVTDVTFSAPGSYTLQLWASDGQYASTDTCVVTAQAVNQPPVVDAGPDVTIAVTSSAHLAGAVSDDGLPGGPLAVQWIQLSGPGQANFTSPTQPVTDVTFSAPGSYTLQLWASDGQYASTDTCVVTVQAVNQPPVVNAGPDLHTTITALTTHLAGQVSDDGLPGGPLAVQWIQLSGPGLSIFTAPTQPATNVVLVGLGTYVFQLWASDGQYASTDTCVVTVTLF